MRALSLVVWPVLAVTAFFLARGVAQEPVPRPVAEDTAPDGIEPLVRGPVHEGFAQPIDFSSAPPVAVPKPPPAPIPEEPPDMQPEGDNVQWLPGYWAWDAETNQFLWVSGVYRSAPPGREWVPGRWAYTDDGWIWVPGFWADSAAPELPYVPQPPDTLDSGPSVAPPDDSSFYIPGVWVYRDTRYVWRPGYWAAYRPGRVWIPSRYVWTPAGYLFNSGYWDLPFENCGLLFAPVRFHRPLWNDPHWAYRPGYVVRPSLFADALFVNRGSGHYYFGNYYARTGFRPWFDAARGDPYAAYYRARHRDNANWLRDMKGLYADRAAGRGVGLPATFEQQRTLLARTDTTIVNRNIAKVVTPLTGADVGVRVTRITAAQLERQRLSAEHAGAIVRARENVEGLSRTPRSGKEVVGSFKVPSVSAIGTPRGAVVGGAPKVEGVKPRGFEAPRIGSSTPKVDARPLTVPRVITSEAPKITTTPKVETPRRIETPHVDRVTPRIEAPKITAPPKVEAPRRIEAPRVDRVTPRIEAPKITAPPKMEAPRRIETPRVDRITPRMEAPKITAPPKMEAPRRIEAPRVDRITPRIPTPRVNPPPVAPRTITPPRKSAAPSSVAPHVSRVVPRVSSVPSHSSRPSPAPDGRAGGASGGGHAVAGGHGAKAH